MSKPRGCTELFPFANHRTLAQVDADSQLAYPNRFGSPVDRAVKAGELESRRVVLGWPFYKTAKVAGIYSPAVSEVLRGVRLASWPILNLIDQALQRGESVQRSGGAA